MTMKVTWEAEKVNFICEKSTKITINWQSQSHFRIKQGMFDKFGQLYLLELKKKVISLIGNLFRLL